MTPTDIVVNEPNRWRLETPGHAGWPRSARPDDPRKYFNAARFFGFEVPAGRGLSGSRKEQP